MNPENMPKNVWKWFMQQSQPLLFILTKGPVATMIYLDDDPEAVEAASKAYEEVMRRRAKKKKK